MRPESILITGGRVIDPSQKLNALRDVWIEDGKISAIDAPGKIPKSKAKTNLSAKGSWVLPGFIDVHVHLREPGQEYKETIESGSRAAVAGGFTSIACMANTQPVNDSAYVTSLIREKAREKALCRVYPVGAVSKGLKGEELAEIGAMVAEGARALSDDGMPIMNSYLMRKALDYAKAFDVAIISHAEDIHLVGQGAINEGPYSSELGLRGNPAAAEEILVARDMILARLTRGRVHIAHISTRGALEHLLRAKDLGLDVSAEVTPHHLTLSERELKSYDTHFKMAPPLRSEDDVEALCEALSSGLIDMIATDHAPHSSVDKQVEFDQAANGIIGLQSAVPVTLDLVHKKILTAERFIEAFTTRPAKLLGIRAGTLKRGAVADITVLDPHAPFQLSGAENFSKSKNSPWMGKKFKGKIKATLVGGRVVYESH